MIKQNEGTLDRVVRVVIGLIVLGISVVFLSGTLQVVGYIVAVVAPAAGIVGYCGLYSVLGISTCPFPLLGLKIQKNTFVFCSPYIVNKKHLSVF